MLGIEQLLIPDDDWRALGRCATSPEPLADVFFSEELLDIARAKAICAECPVMAECLAGAIEREEPYGVWGGQLFLNGKVLMQKRRRGRPPKVPRPEDHLPDVPVPEHLRPLLRTA
jgi:WhiB family redox-sensing transcriptional regulator